MGHFASGMVSHIPIQNDLFKDLEERPVWKINLASSLLLFAQCMLSTLCKVLVDPFPLRHSARWTTGSGS